MSFEKARDLVLGKDLYNEPPSGLDAVLTGGMSATRLLDKTMLNLTNAT
ncbi:MAG: hypothetical protein R6U68_12415 [Desulfobacteraceae bacterium]